MVIVGKPQQSKTARSRECGATLAELLVASVLITFIFAVVGEIVVLTTMSTLKLENQVNATDSARQALRKISVDVKSARCFGDFYGNLFERNIFPASANPKYGVAYSGQGPQGGWPGYPWTSQPFRLSSTCLIVQQPVFYESTTGTSQLSGYPMMLKKDSIGPNIPPVSLEDLDTVVYQVVPDSDLGKFKLQMVRYANFSVDARLTQGLSCPAEVLTPQTLAAGLIGPKALGAGESDLPQVFSYYKYDETDSGNLIQLTSSELENPAFTPQIVGVAVDLEILQSGSNKSYSKRTAVRGECFLGNNQRIVMMNTDG